MLLTMAVIMMQVISVYEVFELRLTILPIPTEGRREFCAVGFIVGVIIKYIMALVFITFVFIC